MQIFEVIEIEEHPYMITKEIFEGETVRDVINEDNEDKVYLLVDHSLKRIWTYNGFKSSYRIQIFGAKLAEMLSRQLKLLYKIYSLNLYSKNDKIFQELMDKSLIGGIAEPINKNDLLEYTDGFKVKGNVSVVLDVNVNKAMEYVNRIPQPKNFIRKFLIIGGNIYTDEQITEAFVKEDKTVKKPIKLGRLNRGFTSFLENYSTRTIMHNRRIQGIEIYVHKKAQSEAQLLELKIPVLYEDRFSKKGSIDALIEGFQIPDELPKKR
ncbi:MAG: hypothetical protein ACFFAN_16070 [Promethearchaeota archaeon]